MVQASSSLPPTTLDGEKMPAALVVGPSQSVAQGGEPAGRLVPRSALEETAPERALEETAPERLPAEKDAREPERTRRILERPFAATWHANVAGDYLSTFSTCWLKDAGGEQASMEPRAAADMIRRHG